MENILDEIFKAYDIRGKVGEQLNTEIIYEIGRAFSDWLPENGPVAVGYDMRPDSKDFTEALIRGIVGQGRDVWNLGMIATDMIYYAVGSNSLAGGAVVTASHNPGEYNGIKLCREDAKPIGENSGLFEIKDNVKKKQFTKVAKQGQVINKDITEGWIDFVISFIEIDKLIPLKLAVDAGNGMAGIIFAELEPFVPWEVTEMYFEPDGTFPNHEANPLKFETLKDLVKQIKENNLYGGIAFDGDGDRAMLVDETGEVLTGGVMSALLAEYFLKKHKGANIIYDARNSKVVPEVVSENGGVAHRVKVGHSNIKEAMREKNSPFGGEASGHFYFKDNWYADSGLLVAVIAIFVSTVNKQKLSEIRKKYTRYETIPETNFVVKDKDYVLRRIKDTFENENIDELDGITVTMNNGDWFNLRASNTEPLIRLNAEAKKSADLENIVKQVTNIINS
jgi:phosphomannomutase